MGVSLSADAELKVRCFTAFHKIPRVVALEEVRRVSEGKTPLTRPALMRRATEAAIG
jgi:hypothetical protein